jgi:hypothetical protein
MLDAPISSPMMGGLFVPNSFKLSSILCLTIAY